MYGGSGTSVGTGDTFKTHELYALRIIFHAKPGYTFTDVAAGTYTLKVSKSNHVTHEYTVVVGNSSVIQDVKICLLGDVNMDGAISILDATEVQKGIAGLVSLNEYQNKLADVNKDGSVRIIDATQI